jgi:hypothetical protein
LIEKAKGVTLSWNLARNPEKNHQKFAEKCKIRRGKKKRKFNYSIAKTFWRFLMKKLRLKNGAKECIV